MFQPIQTTFLACSLLFSASTLAQHSVTNVRGESTECSQKGKKMQCDARIEAFTFEDQPYVFEKEQNNLFIYRPFEYDITITDEINMEGKCGVVIPNELIFCEEGLSDFEYEGMEWGFDTRGNGFLEYILCRHTVTNANGDTTKCTKHGNRNLICRDQLGAVVVLDGISYQFLSEETNGFLYAKSAPTNGSAKGKPQKGSKSKLRA